MIPKTNARLSGLQPLNAASAAKVKMAGTEAPAPAPVPHVVPGALPAGEHPGVERWPVKTGTDADVAKVGNNVVKGEDLGKGLVDTTVEEMLKLKRAANMPPVKSSFETNSFFQNHRAAPTETTVWRLTATITEAKLEQDGDYHLVLKGDSGSTMIGEIPNPDPAFVGNADWRKEIQAAREAMDLKLGTPLKAIDFKPEDMAPPTKDRFEEKPMEDESKMMTTINLRAKITGVGFFDSVHGQTGVAPTGIELHPILNVEFL
jgi:hypothetical protein